MMKSMKALAVGIVAAVGLMAAPRMGFATDSVTAALRLESVTEEAKDLTGFLAAGSQSEWDAQRLNQAVSRLPSVILSGTNAFNIQRKFQRVSDLFLVVRDELIELAYETEIEAIEYVVIDLEANYIDLVLALEAEGILK